MADEQTVHDQVMEVTTKIVAEQVGADQKSVSYETDLNSLGIDSLDRVEIVMKLEEELGVEVDDDTADSLTSIGDWVDYLVSLKQGTAEADS